VGVGFWLDYKRYAEPKADHVNILTKQINENRRSIGNVSSLLNKIVEEISQMKVYK
jgi:predicted DNA-binding ribbon-helix-helix protein